MIKSYHKLIADNPLRIEIDNICRKMPECIQAFRPMDATFMGLMFSGDPAFAQEIIRIIMGIPALTVTEITTWHRIDLQSAGARSVSASTYTRATLTEKPMI